MKKQKPLRYSTIEQLDVDTIEELQNQAVLYYNRYRDVTGHNHELREKLTKIRSILLPMIEKEMDCRPENTKIVLDESGFNKEQPNNAVECAEVLRKIIYYQFPMADHAEKKAASQMEEIKRLNETIAYKDQHIEELNTIIEKQKGEQKPIIYAKSTGMTIIVKEKNEKAIRAESMEPADPFEEPADIRIEHEDQPMREVIEPIYFSLLKEKGIEMFESKDPKFDQDIIHQGKKVPFRYIDFVIDSVQFFDDLMEDVDNICLLFSDQEAFRKGNSQFTKWIIRSPRRKEIEFSLTSMEKLKTRGLETFNHL